MHPRIPLPHGWRRHTKSAIVQILALSHYDFTASRTRVDHLLEQRTFARHT